MALVRWVVTVATVLLLLLRGRLLHAVAVVVAVKSLAALLVRAVPEGAVLEC